MIQMAEKTSLELAIECYARRQNRAEHPDGKFDKGGRWYPSEAEVQVCCSRIRTPSRTWPYSLMRHCRSVEHVAKLYGVSVTELRRVVR